MEEQESLINATQPINMTKGYIKELLKILDDNKMTKENKIRKDSLLGLLKELYSLSEREYMNNSLYFFTRRQKTILAKFILEELYNDSVFTEKEYENIKKRLNYILFENFSRQILPKRSGIIPAKNHKSELYLNIRKWTEKKVLEPREYIGIIPEAMSDLDAPSLVTAMTPPHYEQPWHDHWENWEITFYTWPAIGKYKTKGKEKCVSADFGDFILFPPKTWHTIENPTDIPVKNLSIKLPKALLDRWKSYSNAPGTNILQKMTQIWDCIYHADFTQQNIPYYIEIYTFDWDKQKHKITTHWRGMIYCIDGDFILEGLWETRKAIKEGDAIILDKNSEILLTKLSSKGRLYKVELTDNWEDFNS